MKKLFLVIITSIQLSANAQDHGHLNIGAAGLNQNDPLTFDNGDIFATSTDYVKTLTYATSGKYAGYYQGNITLTGLATTSGHGGPDDNAASPGTVIYAELSTVQGPVGGSFAFWESNSIAPTFSVAAGSTSTNTFRVTESDGSPGGDPYGHIHGRRFTATVPGIYEVTFRALDLSTNGVGSGPIHAASAPITIYFQAGVNIKSIEPDVDHTHVTFSAPVGKSWVVEASDSLATNAVWNAISAPITGDDYFHEVTDDSPVEGRRFYRTRGF